jgi:hypothetical protein
VAVSDFGQAMGFLGLLMDALSSLAYLLSQFQRPGQYLLEQGILRKSPLSRHPTVYLFSWKTNHRRRLLVPRSRSISFASRLFDRVRNALA